MDREQIKEKIRQRQVLITENLKEIAELESQLSEPELRHGDYGIWHYEQSNRPPIDVPAIYAAEDDIIQYLERQKNGTVRCSNINTNRNNRHLKVYGNLVDDLAAMAEDVEEFEVEGFHVYLLNDKVVCGGKRFEIEQFAEFIQKGRALLATAKRKGKK